jgi:hypothetical protein
MAVAVATILGALNKSDDVLSSRVMRKIDNGDVGHNVIFFGILILLGIGAGTAAGIILDVADAAAEG